MTEQQKSSFALRLQIMLGSPIHYQNGIYYGVNRKYEVFGNFSYVTDAKNRNIRIYDLSNLMECMSGMMQAFQHYAPHSPELNNIKNMTWEPESLVKLLEIAEKFLARAAYPLHEYINEKRQADYSFAGYDFIFTRYSHAQGVKAGFIASDNVQDWAEYSAELEKICFELPNLVPYVKDGIIHLQEN